MTTQADYSNARKKVEARISFYTHLGVYLAVMTLITILNLTVAGDSFWAMWPMIGWGSGVIIHGLFTFVFKPGTAMKDRLIEKELQKGGLS